MDSVRKTLSNFGFVFFGIYIDAMRNSSNELKKRCLLPFMWDNIETETLETVWDKNYGIARNPNGYAINTELSDISVIDIDKPDECMILDKLLKECKFYVKTKKGYHFYFKKNDLPRRKMCGIADINTQLLYLCPEYQEFEYSNEIDSQYISKKTNAVVKTKKLVGYKLVGDKYKYSIIKSDKLVDMSEDVYNWCKQLIVMDNKIVKNDKKVKGTKIINVNIVNNAFNITQMNCIYDIFYKNGLFESYSNWRDIAYISRHLNNSEECFKLFDKYSRKVLKYKNANEIDNRIVFYQNNEYEELFDYSSVLYKCKKLDRNLFNTHLNELYLDKGLNSTKINTRYIHCEENLQYFNDWWNNYSVMMIKSSYGTGKTFAFKELLKTYNPERVLFITYRQSLAWSLIDELKKEFGFESYQNRENFNIMEQNRVIVQLDSIHLLRVKKNLFKNEPTYAKYDLIVLDEIEGLLNHMSFNKINQVVI